MSDIPQPPRLGARTILLQSLAVWGGMLLLLVVEAAVAHLGLGSWGIAIPLACAAVEVALVALFGMQLVREGGLLRLAAAAAVIWLTIMFGLTLSDFLTRGLF